MLINTTLLDLESFRKAVSETVFPLFIVISQLNIHDADMIDMEAILGEIRCCFYQESRKRWVADVQLYYHLNSVRDVYVSTDHILYPIIERKQIDGPLIHTAKLFGFSINGNV